MQCFILIMCASDIEVMVCPDNDNTTCSLNYNMLQAPITSLLKYFASQRRHAHSMPLDLVVILSVTWVSVYLSHDCYKGIKKLESHIYAIKCILNQRTQEPVFFFA